MRLSIVIPTLNEELYLPRLLKSISMQEPIEALQIIISDAKSDDKTKEVAKKYAKEIQDLLFIESYTRGVSRQRNAGARHAKHNILLFLDADMLLPKKFLINLEKRIDSLKIKNPLILVTHIPTTKNIFDLLFVVTVLSFVTVMRYIKPICSGSFLLTTKTMHDKIGGFNESIVLAEDVDYGNRSIDNGSTYKLFYRPFVYASPRRLYSTGRINLLWVWTRGYLHTISKGPILRKTSFNYKFGEYTKKIYDKETK